MNPHSKALDSMIGDMDDLETKKMFPEEENKGVSITISVSPQGDISQEPKAPEEGVELMNKGGMAEGCYSEGGVVEPETEDMSLPPFLRKKKKGIQGISE